MRQYPGHHRSFWEVYLCMARSAIKIVDPIYSYLVNAIYCQNDMVHYRSLYIFAEKRIPLK